MAYHIDLKGKVAVVTGASRGIGAATAELLVEAGARVIIDDILPPDEVAGLVGRLAEKEQRTFYIQKDISTEEGARALIERSVEEFGRVDFLINNAGVVADWDKSWQVHVKGAYFCAEAFRDHVNTREGKGRIVNITSTAAFTGSTGIPQYTASKGGMYSLSRYLARTYAPEGILVNGIAPAVIKSEMLMTRYEDEEELINHYIPQMPIRRIGYPEDIAGIVLFLLSPLSDYICGEIIIADGGRMHVG